MPTRIRPYRPGYGDNPTSAEPGDPPDGYVCEGILRPCIEPMTGTDYECLPKATCGLMTNVPYTDLTTLKDDLILPALMDSCDEQFDPQDGSIRIDLWAALQRAGLDTGIDTGCDFPYVQNNSDASSEGDFPIESESSIQPKYCPGYMDPVIVPFPSIGDGAEIDDEIPSSEDDSSSGEEDEFEHPFKARVNPLNPGELQVGFLRPRWEDKMLIADQTDDSASVIDFPAVETIVLDFTAWYVYYDVYKTTAGPWKADLEKTNIWPPPCCETAPHAVDDKTYTGNIQILIGYADTNDGLNYTWQQHMYESPTLQQSDIRGQFEAWYIDDGFVRIDGGAVEAFTGGGAVVPQTFDLAVDTDIWVEVVSTHGTSTSIAVTPAFVTGAFPGLYKDVNCTTTNFNFLIGTISGNSYHPAHKGKIDIDNTLFMFDCGTGDPEEFMAALCTTGGSDEPRVMFFSAESTYEHATTVGDQTNGQVQLYHGFSYAWDIRGGGTESLTAETEYNWFGLGEDSGDDFVDIGGSAGSTLDASTEIGGGSLTLLSRHLDWKWDHGILQQWDWTDADFGAAIEGGENITFDYTPGAGAVPGPASEATIVINSRGGLKEIDATEKFQVVTGDADPSAYGSGWAKIQGYKLQHEFIWGHVETFDITAGDSLTIAAGANIKVDYAAGTATISSDPDAGGAHTSVSVITDIQLTGSGAGLALQIKRTDMEVVNPVPDVAGWTDVTGWAVTVCP